MSFFKNLKTVILMLKQQIKVPWFVCNTALQCGLSNLSEFISANFTSSLQKHQSTSKSRVPARTLGFVIPNVDLQ